MPSKDEINRLLPEHQQLEQLLALAGPLVRSETIANIEYQGNKLPIRACYLGSNNKNVPVLAFIGGIHGVERIGCQVIMAFLETLVQRLQWDHSLITGLQNLRLLFIPIVNPVGVLLQSRANGAGIDLMRNAPIDAESRPHWLAGGQRLTSRLPWYRGKRGAPMAAESSALCAAVANEINRSPFTLLLDVHSGYGFNDRLWFPLARSQQPVQHLPEIYALHQLLERTYPNLNYIVEPQSKQYLTHGDLWDYLYLNKPNNNALFLPFTLEMGSWNWIKKNPRQLSSFFGMFNPVKPHRIQRVLRRHTMLLEFLIRAARAYENWLPAPNSREILHTKALKLWYEKEPK